MVITNIFPWEPEPVVIQIPTERRLTSEEIEKMRKVYSHHCSPWGPPKSLKKFVKELKKENLSYLTDLIVILD